ncbi:hypothetical protein [Pseudomonas xionganensis]|nr:hypothetical protein [Pseudomonas xionganensis]
MPSKRSHIRRAGRMSSLLAIALLTLPLPTQAADGSQVHTQQRCSAQPL